VSIFKINVVASNPANEGRTTEPQVALVDTSTDLTWLPGAVLRDIGVAPRRKRLFEAAGKIVEREVGYVILRANGYETTDEVIFAEPGDAIRVGVRSLEGFGVPTDVRTHRFVGMDTLAAFKRHELPNETERVVFRRAA
jgi:predicted aspartyl protease